VAENGKILAESPLFEMKDATVSVDLERLLAERRKMTTFGNMSRMEGIEKIYFNCLYPTAGETRTSLFEEPLYPEQEEVDLERVSLILKMQAMGLVKRLRDRPSEESHHRLIRRPGLDLGSLLVTVEAFKHLGYDLKGILAVTLASLWHQRKNPS
jgi:NAD+ synthase (glutamine-hydrolysing)